MTGSVRNYDAILIAQPDLNEEGLNQLKSQLGELVSRQGGRIKEVSSLGRRRLGYRIGKASEGTYLQLKMEMPPEGVEALRRNARLLESVRRLMVLVDAGLDVRPQELEGRTQEEDA